MERKIRTLITAAILILSAIGLVPAIPSALAISPSPFSTFGQPVIGIAASPGKLLVTNYCGNPRVVYSLDSSGGQSVFATLPSESGGCQEDYVAISPGLGGFLANHIFVDQGPNIIEVTPTGTTLGVFATISSLPNGWNGITFDHIGTFGFSMIITSGNGQVWRVDSTGTPTLVVNLPGFVQSTTAGCVGGPGICLEGPDVAPMSFVPFGGQVLAAAETVNKVYAISSSGVVSSIPVFDPEFVHFVPAIPCNFGSSGGSLFDVNFSNNTIIKFPASDLAGLSGSAIVTSEFGGGINVLTSSGGTIATSTFAANGTLAQQEGATIVDCSIPTLKVQKFFTDSSLNPLPTDSFGNPKVDVVLSRGIVTSTNPGQVLAWVNVTNTAKATLQSLKVNETLPVDWFVDPPWMPGVGAIHVFWKNSSTAFPGLEITSPSTITVTTGNPETVKLAIPSLNATALGRPLAQGESILLSVKLTYGLIKTSQSAASYPRNYTDTASAAAFRQPNYTGGSTSGTAFAFFIAYAKVVSQKNDPPLSIPPILAVAAALLTAPILLRRKPQLSARG